MMTPVEKIKGGLLKHHFGSFMLKLFFSFHTFLLSDTNRSTATIKKPLTFQRCCLVVGSLSQQPHFFDNILFSARAELLFFTVAGTVL